MWIVWGTVSGERDIGVVAERCPRCRTVAPCRVTGIVSGIHFFFIPMAEGVTQAACTCGACGNRFPCETWRYREMVPFAEALSLEIGPLLDRTNPALKEELEWSRRLERFAADPRFEEAFRSLDELRPGPLRLRLRDDLRRWGGLDEGRREDLVRTVDESARAMRFTRSMAAKIPMGAGCLSGLLACFAVWGASFGILAWEEVGLLWGIGLGLAGLCAGAAAYQFVQGHRVRRWTRDVLIPESRKSGVDFRRVIDILDDLPPPGPRSHDSLHPLQEQARTIREELASFGVKGTTKASAATDPDAF